MRAGPCLASPRPRAAGAWGGGAAAAAMAAKSQVDGVAWEIMTSIRHGDHATDLVSTGTAAMGSSIGEP